ncbi:MAG: hypothetical protein RL026_2099 [Pseudomonadota bacterium]
MSTLAGIYAYGSSAAPIEDAGLLSMSKSLAGASRRDSGHWLSPGRRVGLGWSGSPQIADAGGSPGRLCVTPDGRYRLLLTGHPYNLDLLCRQHSPRPLWPEVDGPASLVLRLHAVLGPRLPGLLAGPFALALWDEQEQSLLLARDALGIKPLYLHDDGRRLRFASRVGALLAGREVVPAPEPAGHVGFWLWGHVPEPFTLHEGIVCLPPGGSLQVVAGGRRQAWQTPTVRQIWASTPPGTDTGLLDNLESSLSHHRPRAARTALLLSGGLYSATLAQLACAAGRPLPTLTLGIEALRGTRLDEAGAAADIARACRSPHNRYGLEEGDLRAAAAEVLATLDQPATGAIGLWLAARAAAALQFTVLLSGHGGRWLCNDGSVAQQLPALRARQPGWWRLPGVPPLLRLLAPLMLRRFGARRRAAQFAYGSNWEGLYLLTRGLRLPWDLEAGSVLDPVFLSHGLQRLAGELLPDGSLDRLGPAAVAVSVLESRHHLTGALLRDADWAGGEHGVEIRLPFIDLSLLRTSVALWRAGRRPRRPVLLHALARAGLRPPTIAVGEDGIELGPDWAWNSPLWQDAVGTLLDGRAVSRRAA